METIYVFVDSRHPNQNLILVSTYDKDLQLERIEVQVEEGQSVVDAVKNKLGI